MARFALERIQDSAASAALRDALPKVQGALKAGVAGSLGARRDAAAVPALVGMLGDANADVVGAAATALGAIASRKAARALVASMAKAPAAAKTSVIDGALRAAEHLTAAGEKAAAQKVYKAIASGDVPEHVKAAASRGLSSV